MLLQLYHPLNIAAFTRNDDEYEDSKLSKAYDSVTRVTQGRYVEEKILDVFHWSVKQTKTLSAGGFGMWSDNLFWLQVSPALFL